MQTIVIVLNPGKLDNPDMDLCYCVPDRVEEISHNAIQDNGYSFIDTEEGQPGPLMGIWLKTEAAQNWTVVKELLQRETFLENDLSASAEIYISKGDTAELESCTRMFPE